MAMARRRQRRELALDVMRLFGAKKINPLDWVQFGVTDKRGTWERHDLPDNPLIHQAIQRELELKRGK